MLPISIDGIESKLHDGQMWRRCMYMYRGVCLAKLSPHFVGLQGARVCKNRKIHQLTVDIFQGYIPLYAIFHSCNKENMIGKTRIFLSRCSFSRRAL